MNWCITLWLSTVLLCYKAKTFLVVFCFVEPGEFSFEQACYFANVVSGDVTCSIIRKKGCDGTVTLTYNTMWV